MLKYFFFYYLSISHLSKHLSTNTVYLWNKKKLKYFTRNELKIFFFRFICFKFAIDELEIELLKFTFNVHVIKKN